MEPVYHCHLGFSRSQPRHRLEYVPSYHHLPWVSTNQPQHVYPQSDQPVSTSSPAAILHPKSALAPTATAVPATAAARPRTRFVSRPYRTTKTATSPARHTSLPIPNKAAAAPCPTSKPMPWTGTVAMWLLSLDHRMIGDQMMSSIMALRSVGLWLRTRRLCACRREAGIPRRNY